MRPNIIELSNYLKDKYTPDECGVRPVDCDKDIIEAQKKMDSRHYKNSSFGDSNFNDGDM